MKIGKQLDATKGPDDIGRSLRRLWSLLSVQDRARIPLLIAAMVVAALLEVLGVGVIPVFVGAVSNPERVLSFPVIGSGLAALGAESQRDILLLGSLLLVVVFAVKAGFAVFVAWAQSSFMRSVQVRLGTRLFRAYMTAPYAFHLAHNPADLMRNANQEVERLVNTVMNPVANVVAKTLIGLAIIVFMLAMSPVVTLVGIGLFGIAGYGFLVAVRGRALALGSEAQRHRAALIKAVNQGLGGFKEARVLGREQSFVAAYAASARRIAVALKHQAVSGQAIAPGLELVAVVGLAAILAVLLFRGTPTEDIIPVLALFGAGLIRVKHSVMQLVSTWNLLRYEHVAVNPVYEHLTELAKSADARLTCRESQARLSGDILLKNVSYRYPGAATDSLRDVSLSIPQGTSVALVGSTGAGKSTLADVLLGLLPPGSGSVTVNGHDISTDLPAWQACIGYIPQSLYLLDDTLRRNIAFGLADAEIDEERVWEAARMAQLEATIAALPRGLDTLVGDRGIRLSGGQRQRVCIARALYPDPEVLVFDEATSALDNLTEKRIVEELEALMGDRTLIVIAHRLSTVERCDRLYMMRDGQIEASGTYAELTESSPLFQQLACSNG